MHNIYDQLLLYSGDNNKNDEKKAIAILLCICL